MRAKVISAERVCGKMVYLELFGAAVLVSGRQVQQHDFLFHNQVFELYLQSLPKQQWSQAFSEARFLPAAEINVTMRSRAAEHAVRNGQSSHATVRCLQTLPHLLVTPDLQDKPEHGASLMRISVSSALSSTPNHAHDRCSRCTLVAAIVFRQSSRRF